MASKIKYAQIGTNHGHATKIRTYAESADYEVVGICEPNDRLLSKAKSNAAYRDVPFMTEEQLLNVPGLQVVGVETKPDDSLRVAQLAIDAGKHVHIDKPAGDSLPKFRELLDTAAKKHLAVQLGYMYRYNPAIVLLREMLSKGWLGDVFEIHTVMSKLGGQAMRDEFAMFEGGTMFELGCHIIDLVHGVLGAPDKVHAFPRHSGSQADNLQDNMLAVFEYPKATATVRTSLTEVDGFARRHFAVVGTKGTMHIQPLDNPSAKLALSQARGKFEKGYQDVKFPRYLRYVADAADLAKVIRHEKDPDFGYEFDYEVQRSVLLASAMPID